MTNSERKQQDGVGLAELVVVIADHLASSTVDSSSLSSLRKLDVENPETNADFQRIRARFGLWFVDDEQERDWASILSGMALLTKTSALGRRRGGGKRSCHNATLSLGWTLFFAGDRNRAVGFYRESLLGKLLASNGRSRRSSLTKMYRMFTTRDCSLNWVELAAFILTREPGAQKRLRRKVAQDYYNAESRVAA